MFWRAHNPVIRTAERRFVTLQAVTLAGCVAVAIAIGDEQAWPVGLLIALVALGCSGVSGLRTDPQIRVNNASIAVILAAILVGPAAAVLVGIAVMLYDAVVFRATARNTLTNAWAYAVWALLIGLAADTIVEPGTGPADELAVVALVALVVGDLMSFWLIAVEVRITAGVSIARSWRRVRSCPAVAARRLGAGGRAGSRV